MADKVLAKTYVAEELGKDWVTPTLWRGSELPLMWAWEFPFVVKARHGCGHFLIVKDAASYKNARRLSRRWIKSRYGGWLEECLYAQIEPGLLIEPLIGDGEHLPVDYKIFVFGGRARFIQVHLGRGEGAHRWIVFDLKWRRVSPTSDDPDPAPPESLSAMLKGAEQLSRGFCFVRADFYDVDGNPRFGELTFYPGSGLERVEPSRLDLLMGMLWAAAMPSWAEPIFKIVA